MSDHLAWAQWWASPWLSSHPEATSTHAYDAVLPLCRSRPGLACAALGIEPCLPPAPCATVLGLALASPEQIDLAIALLDLTCHPNLDSPLCDEHRKWCERLAKALHPGALLQPDDDSLQLLRAWVEPAVWQRLRLRLVPHRVQAIESTYLSLDDAHGRLNTLWQAIVWRIAATHSELTHR
ncbi:hypothetical protein SAMN05216475_0157 [Pseudomonas synxantha]|uniref:Type III secretion protein RspD n=1 Tax=Pseudomonas synxantha TaxID=47883 RepID=A0AAX3I0Z4_9PSED|nr:RspD [Pseudomonas synxantha]KRP49931.1 hypothetical protein TU77_24375 [Pseudomonas synxantha]SDT97027.1 hypothetical protein SAMN05216475_0157 [Pseudomonas synxantha]VTQ90587.1 type III secretion protein RspD [Pseudomonas synxantha]